MSKLFLVLFAAMSVPAVAGTSPRAVFVRYDPSRPPPAPRSFPRTRGYQPRVVQQGVVMPMAMQANSESEVTRREARDAMARIRQISARWRAEHPRPADGRDGRGR